MAQQQGFCMCGTNRLKTRPVLHRWDEKQGKGHICYQLDANVQMFSRSLLFRIIHKHDTGI